MVPPDVEEVPGHIACDGRSRSEIVVPVFDRAASLIAVLDVDSERLGAFDDDDTHGLSRIVGSLSHVRLREQPRRSTVGRSRASVVGIARPWIAALAQFFL